MPSGCLPEEVFPPFLLEGGLGADPGDHITWLVLDDLAVSSEELGGWG